MQIVLGLVCGLLLGGGFWALVGVLFDLDAVGVLLLGGICGAVGATYSAIAFGNSVYSTRPFSIIGYVLDMTWSILNTFAGLAVWMPACLIVGGRLVTPDGNSRRSGCFVYDKNPRGTSWDTTIGCVVAGRWSAHEEIHVWQARLLGPLYLPAYGLALVLNMFFRLVTGRLRDIPVQAYHRVCFEDWAYWSGSSSSSSISWGFWMLGLFLTLTYVAFLVLIPAGIAVEEPALWAVGLGGLVLYSVVRSLTPAGH